MRGILALIGFCSMAVGSAAIGCALVATPIAIGVVAITFGALLYVDAIRKK